MKLPNQIQTQTAPQTYEQTKTNTTLQQSPDPIHWNPKYAFRSQPYRQLTHQNHTIGHFHVRLVEAKNLKRSHWSVLGMGLVKHLGLSHAHGEVSSFCNFRLGYRFRSYNEEEEDDNCSPCHSRSSLVHEQSNHQYNWQHGNIASNAAATAAATKAMHSSPKLTKNNNIIFTNNNNTYKSSTIPSNSNPKWPSVQTKSNRSTFEIPLQKGSMPHDGMEIILSVQMKEEKSAVDSFVPIGTGGGGGSDNKCSNDDGFILGGGQIDLTGLVMQGYTSSHRASTIATTATTKNESGIVDVYDEWITLTNYDEKQDHVSSSASASASSKSATSSSNENHHSSSCGQVRLIISYTPNGLQPQKNDIIAFESFARKSKILSNCPTVIPPLHPLKVKEVKGEHILAEFDLSPVMKQSNSINSNYLPCAHSYYTNEDYDDDDEEDCNNNCHQKKRLHGMVRIHRNAIFVIERTNIVDSAIDISLKPTDILMSTELGQNVSSAAQPYVEAAGDILAPILLSSKLLLEAGKVGGGALAIGLKSAVVSVVENSDPERRRKVKRTTSSSAYEYH